MLRCGDCLSKQFLGKRLPWRLVQEGGVCMYAWLLYVGCCVVRGLRACDFFFVAGDMF